MAPETDLANLIADVEDKLMNMIKGNYLELDTRITNIEKSLDTKLTETEHTLNERLAKLEKNAANLNEMGASIIKKIYTIEKTMKEHLNI